MENNMEMINEVMNEEVTAIAEAAPEVISNNSGNTFVKVVVGGLMIAAAGIGAWAIKNRDKLEERQIRKLEKKGYLICKPEETEKIDEEITIAEIN